MADKPAKSAAGSSGLGEAADIGADIMNEVASRLTPFPQQSNADDGKKTAGDEDDKKDKGAKKEKGEEGGDDHGEETEEEKAERLANETPEEKAERERLEAEAGKSEDDQGDTTETEEEKAERLANETPEEKAERERLEAEAAKGDDDQGDDKKGKPPVVDTSKEVATALKDLPEETRTRVQTVVDKIVGRVVGRERAEKERLGERVTELTTELETAKKRTGPVQIAGISPLMLADEEADINKRETQIDQFMDWAEDHADGVEATGEPGDEGYKPGFTAAQVRAKVRELRRERERQIPAAREHLKTRAENDKTLKTDYPEAFDPKSAEYAAIERVYTKLPEVRRLADARLFALQQFLGERALAELLKQRKEKKPAGQKSEKQEPKAQPARKPVPRAPGAGGPAKGGVMSPKNTKPAASEAVNTVYKDPSNKRAFASAVETLTADL